MARPALLVLAAGLGTRFGGLKQLVPVGPRGEVIMDYLLERAADAGYGRAVVIVAPSIEERVGSYLASRSRTLPVALVVQPPVPGRARPLGTAQAVLAARDAIDGPFVVVNADDLYPPDAFTLLDTHFLSAPAGEHALVAFSLANTLVGDRPVSRALLAVGADDRLIGISEGTAVRAAGGVSYTAGGARSSLSGDEPVSMNMWGFWPSIFAVLDRTVREFIAARSDAELLLPDVVGFLVAAGEPVHVLRSRSPCIGVTHAEDVALVRALIG